MPGKHVRFLDVVPSTPSSTFTASTISSSSGPATPPPVWLSPPSSVKAEMGSPYSSPYSSPYMAPAPVPVQIHTILALTVGHGSPLDWDLAEPAESARVQVPYLPARLTDALVREPATYPPLPSLAILCDLLPWMLTVSPTPDALWAAPYVTVGDVLLALYRTLRIGVTDPELNVLEDAQHDRVHDAYVRRYRRVPPSPARDAEKAKYIKRVDFLRDHRAFLGLSLVNGGLPPKGLPHGVVWALHVARSP